MPEEMLGNEAALLYRDIFENAPFGVYTLNASGVITSFNPKMTEISGVAPGVAIGISTFELDEYRKSGLSELFRQGVAGQAFEKKVTYTSHFGRKTTIRYYRGIPIRGIVGHDQARLLLIVEDVTDREKLSKELEDFASLPKQSNNPVFRMGAKGRVLLANDHAKKLLHHWDKNDDYKQLRRVALDALTTGVRTQFDIEEKNSTYTFDILPMPDLAYVNIYGRDITEVRRAERMRSMFLAIASHELRTPMTVIAGYADLLLKQQMGPLSDQQQQYISQMLANAKHLLGFVNTMLDISKFESGEVQMKVARGDVAAVVAKAVEDIHLLYEEAGVELAVEASALSAMINVDELLRAVTNLLSNALKFTPSGGTVTVRVADNGKEAVVSVSDTGPGMTEEDLHTIFHAYAQADVDAALKMKSTGLGLVITRDIVQAMRGRIWAESQLGHGAAFFIALPLAG